MVKRQEHLYKIVHTVSIIKINNEDICSCSTNFNKLGIQLSIWIARIYNVMYYCINAMPYKTALNYIYKLLELLECALFRNVIRCGRVNECLLQWSMLTFQLVLSLILSSMRNIPKFVIARHLQLLQHADHKGSLSLRIFYHRGLPNPE